MLVIGLTGGLGSGKSTAAGFFSSLGCKTISMDAVARELSRPGCKPYEQIVAAFGQDILDQQGEIQRPLLREIVFADPDKRKILEEILHPAIHQHIQHQLETMDADICIVEIPLLNYKSQFDFIDRILVIDTDPALQAERTQRRDQLSRQQIDAIIGAQIDPASRLALADDIITNNGSKDELRQQVQSLHRQYLRLAQHCS